MGGGMGAFMGSRSMRDQKRLQRVHFHIAIFHYSFFVLRVTTSRLNPIPPRCGIPIVTRTGIKGSKDVWPTTRFITPYVPLTAFFACLFRNKNPFNYLK